MSSVTPGTGSGRAVRATTVAAVVMLALALVLGVGWVAWQADREAAARSPRPDPTRESVPRAAPAKSSAKPATPRATPSRRPGPRPTGHDHADEPRTPMGNNPLYSMVGPLDGTCDAPLLEPPVTDDPHQGLQLLANCLTATWADAYRKAVGGTLPAPRVETIDRATETPCGPAVYNGFYCSLNKSIYLRLDAITDGGSMSEVRIAALFMVAHEFGHHLQYMAGIWESFALTYEAAYSPLRQVLRRRLELQADCFTGMAFRTYAAHYAITPADYEALATLREGLADDDHGSGEAQLYWQQTGLDFGDFGLCNTWEVPDDLVM